MKIAIPTENGKVSPHFGRCLRFTIVEMEDQSINSIREVDNPGHHPGLLPDFFSSLNIDTVLAGGMGMRAREMFREKNIEVKLGIEGTIEEVLDDLKNNRLIEGPSSCKPGSGKGYGLEKPECDHMNDQN